MTRPTLLGQTSPSTAELGPFLNSAADNPQSRGGAVLSTAPACQYHDSSSSERIGSIVNVSTTFVGQPIAGIGAAVQIMTKGGLDAVTRALAIEYAKEGIRVNTVALGTINTPMHKSETHEFLKGLHPVGRMGEVKEVVDAVLFLTDATFTTGEILHVDGGAHAGKW